MADIDIIPPGLPGDAGDWPEVFKYAGGYGGAKVLLAVPETSERASEPQPLFGLVDVAEVIAAVAGENDGDEWLAFVRLHDGRFGFVAAGCDYTGWG